MRIKKAKATRNENQGIESTLTDYQKGAPGLKFGNVEIWVFFEENGKSAFSDFCREFIVTKPCQAASPFEYSFSSFFL